MKRRELFGLGLKKTVDAVVKGAEAQVEKKALNWIRPPFAQNELSFLLSCTRCDDCIESCEYGILFPLSARLGPQVAGTPAMDLLRAGCHLCEGWPCVAACKSGSLVLPKEQEGEPRTLPVLAQAQIDPTGCLPYMGPECGACKESCPVPGALLWQGIKPMINGAVCVGCALCRGVCVVRPKAVGIKAAFRSEGGLNKGFK